ncbi:MAG: YdeI/OmpD-associated family protein [Fulvivirga sp.]
MIKTFADYLNKHNSYSDEITALRNIVLDCDLKETIKWGIPVYTSEGKNVVGLSAFKSYFGLWFYQGALINDTHNKLINAQEGKTQAMRQWRFESIDEIDPKLIKKYVLDSVDNFKAGKEIKPQKKPLIIPDELKEAMAQDSELSEAFDSLTLTYKREFAEYVGDAKREETRKTRLEKVVPMIKEKKGLHDKYR